MTIPAARLQDKAGICAYLGGISPATYDKWHAKGIVPGPVRGTNRYDLRAHDRVLDHMAGLVDKISAPAGKRSALEEFEGRAH